MTSHAGSSSKVPGALVGIAAFGAACVLVWIGAAIAPAPQPEELANYRPSPTVTTQPAPLVPELPVSLAGNLSIQTCARIAEDQTSEGVWNAAAALEVGPNALEVEAAWAAVSTFVAYDCDVYTDLVNQTIEEVTG